MVFFHSSLHIRKLLPMLLDREHDFKLHLEQFHEEVAADMTADITFILPADSDPCSGNAQLVEGG